MRRHDATPATVIANKNMLIIYYMHTPWTETTTVLGLIFYSSYKYCEYIDYTESLL